MWWQVTWLTAKRLEAENPGAVGYLQEEEDVGRRAATWVHSQEGSLGNAQEWESQEQLI